jgi:hypothetical protein
LYLSTLDSELDPRALLRRGSRSRSRSFRSLFSVLESSDSLRRDPLSSLYFIRRLRHSLILITRPMTLLAAVEALIIWVRTVDSSTASGLSRPFHNDPLPVQFSVMHVTNCVLYGLVVFIFLRQKLPGLVWRERSLPQMCSSV